MGETTLRYTCTGTNNDYSYASYTTADAPPSCYTPSPAKDPECMWCLYRTTCGNIKQNIKRKVVGATNP